MMITLKCELLNIVEQTASSESEACSFRAQGNLNLYQAHDRNCVDCGSACVLSVPYFFDPFSPIFCSAPPPRLSSRDWGFFIGLNNGRYQKEIRWEEKKRYFIPFPSSCLDYGLGSFCVPIRIQPPLGSPRLWPQISWFQLLSFPLHDLQTLLLGASPTHWLGVFNCEHIFVNSAFIC